MFKPTHLLMLEQQHLQDECAVFCPKVFSSSYQRILESFSLVSVAFGVHFRALGSFQHVIYICL